MWILLNKVDDEWRPFESTWRMDRYKGTTVRDYTVYLSRAKALAEMNDYITLSDRDCPTVVAEEEMDYHLLEIMPRQSVSIERLIMEALNERMPDMDVDFYGIGSDTPAQGFTTSALSDAITDIKAHCEEQGLSVYVVPSRDDLPIVVGKAVYLVADALGDVAEVEKILASRLVRHTTLASLVGDKWPLIVSEIQQLKAKGDPQIVRLTGEAWRRYGGHNHVFGTEVEVKEILTVAVEMRMDEGPIVGLLRRLREAIANTLRQMGFRHRFDTVDLDAVITAAEKGVESDQGTVHENEVPGFAVVTDFPESSDVSRNSNIVKDDSERIGNRAATHTEDRHVSGM